METSGLVSFVLLHVFPICILVNSNADSSVEAPTYFLKIPVIHNAQEAICTHPFIIKGLDGDFDNSVREISIAEGCHNLPESCGTEGEEVAWVNMGVHMPQKRCHPVRISPEHSPSSNAKNRQGLSPVLGE